MSKEVTRTKFGNSQIKALREQALQENDVRNDLPPQERSRCIHIGWLFQVEGKPALKAVCRRLDSTPNSLPGWQDLACELNLDSTTIGCIKNKMFLGETETYYTLLTAAQDNDLTLDKLLDALEKIGRLDALQVSKEPIERLINHVLENQRAEYSIISDGIIKPVHILTPPALVLQSGDSQQNAIESGTLNELVNLFQRLVLQLALSRGIQQQTPLRSIEQKREEPIELPRENCILAKNSALTFQDPPLEIPGTVVRMKYNCTVMLTFARDGLKYIEDIKESLRKVRPDGRRIGVLVLDEHSTKVEENPQDFILKFMQQVNYIMPVITEGYLKSIFDISAQIYPSADDTLDTKWTRYIYTLMNNDYIKRGCLNSKTRCLVPDHLLHLTQRHSGMKQPIFETWYRVNEVEKVGDILLANMKRRRLLCSRNTMHERHTES